MMARMSATASSDVRPTPSPAEAPVGGEGTVMAAFLALVFIGGSNFVAVRFTTFGLDPLWGAGSRFSLAAIVLVLIGLAIRAPFPRGRALVGASLYGLLSFGVFFALTYLALVDAPSAVAAVVLAVVPLVTFLLALAQRQERFRWRALIGGVVALAGMGLMVGTPNVPLGSFLALGGAALAAGEAGVIAKWFPKAHPVTMNAVAMAVGSLGLLALSLVRNESWILPKGTATWAVQVYLITIGSVGLFVLYLFVLKRWTATRTAFAFVLFPVVAAVLGAWLLDDPITLSLAVGSVVVLAGVYIGAIHGALSGEPAQETTVPQER
jgi:drug/metabolite transporter (DMT)-like permease